MGVVVGEKLARLFDHALATAGLPVVVFSCLGRRADAGRRAVADADGEGVGGDRAAARRAACRTSAVLCDPTTGGVAASFAMLGDLNLAEPGALIGFAGRRVIGQTTNQQLPDDFQTRRVSARARDARRDRPAPSDAPDAREAARNAAPRRAPQMLSLRADSERGLLPLAVKRARRHNPFPSHLHALSRRLDSSEFRATGYGPRFPKLSMALFARSARRDLQARADGARARADRRSASQLRASISPAPRARARWPR